MNMPKNLVVLSAGLGQPSSTRLLADRLASATLGRLRGNGIDATLTVIEVRELALEVTNNLLTGFPAPALATAIDAVSNADGLIAVTPIFTTSYSGLFKSFIDVLDPTALTDMPVALGATGGTERHSLAIDYALRPLFTYLHAKPVTTGVYAASSDWGEGAESGATLADRIERASRELAQSIAGTDRSANVTDTFALKASFETLTGGFASE